MNVIQIVYHYYSRRKRGKIENRRVRFCLIIQMKKRLVTNKYSMLLHWKREGGSNEKTIYDFSLSHGMGWHSAIKSLVFLDRHQFFYYFWGFDCQLQQQNCCSCRNKSDILMNASRNQNRIHQIYVEYCLNERRKNVAMKNERKIYECVRSLHEEERKYQSEHFTPKIESIVEKYKSLNIFQCGMNTMHRRKKERDRKKIAETQNRKFMGNFLLVIVGLFGSYFSFRLFLVLFQLLLLLLHNSSNALKYEKYLYEKFRVGEMGEN